MSRTLLGRNVRVFRASTLGRPLDSFELFQDSIRRGLRAARVNTTVSTSSLSVGMDGGTFKLLSGACVYTWWRDDKCLYVGQSGSGLARPLAHGHHAITEVLPTDHFQFFFASEKDIDDLEWWLIRLLRPERNKAQVWTPKGVLLKVFRNKWICSSSDCGGDAIYHVVTDPDSRYRWWLCRRCAHAYLSPGVSE